MRFRVATLLLSVVVSAGLAGAAGGEATPPRWAALGDSYSSGEGIPDAQGACQRATGTQAAWPAGARQALGEETFLDQAFVACTGAVTDDAVDQLLEAGRNLGDGQFDLVSFSFGGNNVGFSDVLLDCLGSDDLGSWRIWDPGCDVTESEMRDRVDALVSGSTSRSGFDTGASLPTLLDQVAAKVGSGGDVLVVGYPRIFEDPAQWPLWQRASRLPCQGIDARDAALFRRVIDYLNARIASAVVDADRRASALGVRFHFIDLATNPYESGDDRHGLCSGEQWLNGITLGNRRPQQSFHPTAAGHAASARVVASTIRSDVDLSDGVTTPGEWELAPGGIGPLRLGMTLGDARKAGVGVRVERGPFCDTWIAPGAEDVLMLAPRSTGRLASIGLSPGGSHGARGLDPGATREDLLEAFEGDLVRVETPDGSSTEIYSYGDPAGAVATQFVIADGEVSGESSGFLGQFYYPDGNELCA